MGIPRIQRDGKRDRIAKLTLAVLNLNREQTAGETKAEIGSGIYVNISG